jgi:hypothetical protein
MPIPSILRPVLAAALGTVAALPAHADRQILWGYGVRSCASYMVAHEAAATGDAAELQRYEDWLTGFVSGLNLAVGEDALRGSGIETALRRARAYCDADPDADFFNAAMAFVRTLSALR